ncbi:MAG TPA: hypothetical protein VFH43_03695, partial [Candidatus Kapabacteria bacterium]|nr:hypothetical protein [Candidatus Kapabacteria bacterium]
MVHRVWALGSVLLLASCGSAEKKSDLASADSAIAIVENTAQPVEPVKPLDTTSVFGAYVGEFQAEEYKPESNYTWSNLITIFIDSMSAETLYGHSVVAGTSTPFEGKYERYGHGQFRSEAREPGTGKYDGVFRFDLDSAEKTLTGKWIANDTSLNVTKRTFALTKRYFKYDPNAVLPEEFANIPVSDFTQSTSEEEGEIDKAESTTEDVLKFNASTTLLKAKDVENMKRGDLEVMR